MADANILGLETKRTKAHLSDKLAVPLRSSPTTPTKHSEKDRVRSQACRLGFCVVALVYKAFGAREGPEAELPLSWWSEGKGRGASDFASR